MGSDAITLSHNQVLTLNVTHNANADDNSFTIALEGNEVALVGGRSFKNTTYRVGVSDEIGMSRGYVFGNTNHDDETANITTLYTANQSSDISTYYKNLTNSTFTANATMNSKFVVNPNSFTLTVLCDQTKNEFVGTMSMGDKSESISLGETFTVNNVVATFVTANTAQVTDLSLSIKTIPEPATATLSLLALCGLAARRLGK